MSPIRVKNSSVLMIIIDKVDIISYSNKSKRIVNQIRDLCAIISGLFVSGNYKQGSEFFSKRTLHENADLFQRIFEVGRRYI